MPSSFHFHLTKMVDWIVRVKPKAVLDIGMGFGKWGFLAREYTDIFANRYQRQDWQTRIDAVEAFPDYKTPCHEYIYNDIHYGDARQVVPTLGRYDLVIVGDVIEHFTKAEGLALLAELRKRSRYVLISSPTVEFGQGDLLGNPYEIHRSAWGIDDLKGLEFDYDEYGNWLFVAMIRGELTEADGIVLDSRAARFAYSRKWLRRHPKLAELAKSLVNRVRPPKAPVAARASGTQGATAIE